MPNKFQLAAAALAALIVSDLIDTPWLSKYRTLARKYNDLIEKYNAVTADLSYLTQVINDSDIELTEFDLLVLTNVKKKD